jgi:hypothetical protein
MADGMFRENTLSFNQIRPGLPLVIVMTGFADAGSAVSQLEEYMWEVTAPEAVGEFNMDLLHDYRARRPSILFEEDHLTDYEGPELALFSATDDIGRPFMLLMGSEPDFRWEEFASSVLSLVQSLEIGPITWVHSIPMPIPHTRPIGVTVSGSRHEIIEARSVWRPTTQVPATMGHVLEHRLHEAGKDITGFVLLVSHYLADTEFPNALIAALECISEATGLIFATDDVREKGRVFLAQIDDQVASNDESAEMVKSLEERHDTYMQDQSVRSPFMTEEGNLPTADQIATELEDYLAAHVEPKRKQDGRDGKDSLGRHTEQDPPHEEI